jgi:hypothetical protein
MNEDPKIIAELKKQVAALTETVAKITHELDLRYKADQEKDLKTQTELQNLWRALDRK